MGVVAGWLMGLRRKTRPVWLAVVVFTGGIAGGGFSLVIWKMLPDGPAKAAWLTTEEKSWFSATECRWRKSASGAWRGSRAGAVVAARLDDWSVLFLPAYDELRLQLFSTGDFARADGLERDACRVPGSVLWRVGAAGMLLNGAHSDRTRERRLHCIVPCATVASRLFDRQLCEGAMDCGGRAGDEFYCIHGDAGTFPCGSDGVSGGARGSDGDCGDEYDHDVLGISGAVLDGRDEGLHGELQPQDYVDWCCRRCFQQERCICLTRSLARPEIEATGRCTGG